MVISNTQQHVYQRHINESDLQDSLSLIASLIKPDQTLLDLGMGTGGLGRCLSQRHVLIADGVTLNATEAEIARSWYRQIVVADLDTTDLTALFRGSLYDCIVCADVLEHLKSPQNVLDQCKSLLKPGGRLIASVPNAAYCGLIAELIQGDFCYRQEGLLDRTHLRFFTRKSLQRFFDQQGWSILSEHAVQRSLLASEFKVAFDSMPPSVARHLLALPDAMTYQIVLVLQPQSLNGGSKMSESASVIAEPAQALFSTQIYLAVTDGYLEERKLVNAGRIGNVRQYLNFDIPAIGDFYTAIRFDPADRPGFFKLHGLRLLSASGDQIWSFDTDLGGSDLLVYGRHQQILFQQPWLVSEGVMLFLCGDDPWLELPLSESVLKQLSQFGGRLEVCCGWPMSADYLQASLAIGALQAQQRAEFKEYQRTKCDLNQLVDAHQKLKSEFAAEQAVSGALQADKQKILGQLQVVRRESHLHLAGLQELQNHLRTIEESTVFRVTRPLVQIKMHFDKFRQKASGNSVSNIVAPPKAPLPLSTSAVDIIVPVYKGIDDLRCCVDSVLRSKCFASWRLILINDCSPEPAVTEWLRKIASTDSRIELLENSRNLGFVATVNRGMALHSERDVVLLNSDVEVANDWLDRIQRAAYSDRKVASVTPFSNNATICSYPRFCEVNDLPAGYDTAKLDALFAKYLNGQTLRLPTGVGFCMYIRRECLQDIGLFDVANFGKGYGEENDFCVRAQAAGWINLQALDIFVRHAGGVSFGDSKNDREIRAMETLRNLHPRYEPDVHAFIRQNPGSAARMTIDVARILDSAKPVILAVTHNREGGTLRHVQELSQHLAGKATFLRLSPAPNGVSLKLEGKSEAFELRFILPEEQANLENVLRMLQVGHIHFHHVLGHSQIIHDLPTALGVSHDFTVHDYYSYCPQISLTDFRDRYCGEEGLEQCHRCLTRNPAPEGCSIESWRLKHAKLLGTARFVIAPSHDAADRILQHFPTANICFVPHSSLLPAVASRVQPNPPNLVGAKPLVVAVLGALSKIKGADILESVAVLAAQSKSPVEFHLLGYAYRNLSTQPKAKLTVHGAYEDSDLPKLLEWLRPDVVWFPAVWPETYSYTLSACLDAGLPVVAPNIGAFCERLQNRSWSWICDWQQGPHAWLAFFEGIRERYYLTGISPPFIEKVEGVGEVNIPMFKYDENYLDVLLPSAELSIESLRLLQRRMSVFKPRRDQISTIIKSSALRVIVWLRSSAMLSPLTKLLSLHTQRRVKSWLRG